MVRLIHTADLHLDSAFSSRFSKEEAEERRQSLLMAWNRLLSYGIEKKVQAVLIAGDLFDSAVVSRSTMEIFLSSIRRNPDISFFYLRGNHDTENTFRFQENLPKNLFLFSKGGKKYRLNEKLILAGKEYYGSTERNKDGFPGQSFWDFKEEDCNLFMLHGELTESDIRYPLEPASGIGVRNEEGAEQDRNAENEVQDNAGISLKALSRYPVHYLALGHIHKRGEGQFGSIRYAYPGCLQGRGFDEEGEKGFFYLEVNEETKEIQTEFIPIKEGEFRILELELCEEDDSLSALEKIEEKIKEEACTEKDSLRILLKGEKSPEGERNLRYLERALSERFSYVEVKEESRLVLRKEEYIHEKSLKGEFLRMVSDSESLSEEEKEKIILLGIGLLQGEEL
ncbi:DNA repair exonuclease [Oribacterium parvum]|uniref:metallophosphoesterase family protein n=1 Tax=Oribacterium parvum TaxID=1501329 RepID=UPI0028E3AB6D|nr:DNA repair exonuclease [Oribacterium parvum]